MAKKESIKHLGPADINEIVPIYLDAFHGMTKREEVKQWMGCRLGAFPQVRCYGIWRNGELLGYIVWEEHGGFRTKAVLELEQIAVKSQFRGQGIGTQLIVDSLIDIKACLKKRGATFKLIKIQTGIENGVQRLYKKALGAEFVATIPDLYRSDEQVMIARFDGK